MPCQRTSLTQLLSLAELVHLVFTVLREPLPSPRFPESPSLSPGVRHVLLLVRALGAVAGALGSSFRSLTEWGPRGASLGLEVPAGGWGCWRTPPSPERLSAGVQWEWGRAPRIALDSSFQGDFPCNCLF